MSGADPTPMRPSDTGGSSSYPAPAGTARVGSRSERAIVLSSGGVDSTTCLALAVRDLGAANVVAASVFYGQRHAKEIACSQAVSKHYGVEHRTLDLSQVLADSDSALLSGSTQEIGHGSYALQMAREQASEAGETGAIGAPERVAGASSDGSDVRADGTEAAYVSTYVPFRNGLMLSAAAALAMSLFPDDHTRIYLGAHADDAAGDAYPDCSPAFTQAMGQAVSLGTYGQVELYAPFVGMTKAQVVACGLELGVPYELTWSCYEGADVPCGECATCLDRAHAFAANGVADPALVRRPSSWEKGDCPLFPKNGK